MQFVPCAIFSFDNLDAENKYARFLNFVFFGNLLMTCLFREREREKYKRTYLISCSSKGSAQSFKFDLFVVSSVDESIFPN